MSDEAAPVPTGLKARLVAGRIYLVPAVCCLMVGLHFYRHYTLHQSSWGAGCGFGMFATVDHHGTRLIRCRIKAGDQTYPARIDHLFAYQNLKTRVVPTTDELTVLAQHLGTLNWHLPDPADSPGATSVVMPGFEGPFQPGQQQILDVLEIELEVRGIRVDQAAHQINSHVLARCSLPIAHRRRVLVRPGRPPVLNLEIARQPGVKGARHE